MKLKSIDQVKSLAGKTVLLRVDFNIPLKNKKVISNYKIVKSLPTINYLLNSGANILILSHLGRPKKGDLSLSLKPVVKELERLLNRKIALQNIKDLNNWEKLLQKTKRMNSGIFVLENTRFFKGEEENDKQLAKKLASLADYFVLDGFAVAHRNAASVSGVAKHIPSFCGLLLKEEITVLNKVIGKPKRPVTVLFGGAKADTKIPVLKNLLKSANHILIGGGILNTYLAANGKKIGSSIVSKESFREIKRLCKNKRIVLPVDVVVGSSDGSGAKIVKVKDIVLSKKQAIYDIGPETVRLFSKYIKKSNTLVWNGAMGMFEQHPYEYGTYSLVRLFASRSKGKAVGVCGGGETVEILEKLNLSAEIDLVSTGGGAMLEYLSGQKLPGLKSLII